MFIMITRSSWMGGSFRCLTWFQESVIASTDRPSDVKGSFDWWRKSVFTAALRRCQGCNHGCKPSPQKPEPSVVFSPHGLKFQKCLKSILTPFIMRCTFPIKKCCQSNCCVVLQFWILNRKEDYFANWDLIPHQDSFGLNSFRDWDFSVTVLDACSRNP